MTAFLRIVLLIGLTVLIEPGFPSVSAADERFTNSPGESRTAYNFARAIAVDEQGGVHAVWADHRNGEAKVYYRRSSDDGKSWQPELALIDHAATPMPADELLPAIAVSGAYVYVGWHEIRNDKINIYLRISSDHGQHFGPEIALTDSGKAAHCSLTADQENVHLVYGNEHEDTGAPEIYYRNSFDHGETWAPAVRLTDLPHASWVPSLEAEGQNVYMAWIDTRDGNEELYFKISRDKGVSWGADTRLSVNNANSWAPSVAVEGDDVHIAWFDQMANEEHPLDVEKSLDHILETLGRPVEPSVPEGVLVPHPQAVHQLRAEMKLRKIMEVKDAWIKQGGAPRKLKDRMDEFEKMGTTGASYAEKEKKLDEALRLMGVAYDPQVVEGLEHAPRIYYLDAMGLRIEQKMQAIQPMIPQWVKKGNDPRKMESLLKDFEIRMNKAVKGWDIYYIHSADGGKSWKETRRLTDAEGLSQRPSMVAQDDQLHLVWFDGRQGDNEIYYKRASGRGQVWGEDVRLTNVPGDSKYPSVAASKHFVHVLWTDQRDGNDEIYYRQLGQE